MTTVDVPVAAEVVAATGGRSPAPLRIGIIGGGFMARVHTVAARASGAVVVAIASASPESARRAATDLAIETAHESAADLIADPTIDVVHVCTPNASHAGYALAAIRAGKHVVCEKPLATSFEDADELARAAVETGLVGAVPFIYRYHPMVREARARIAAGQIGRVLSIRGSYLQDWLLSGDDIDWRTSSATGGPSRAFADIGSHLVDLVEFVTGEGISRLTAIARTVHERRGGEPVDTEDEAAVLFETDSGAIGTLFVSQVSPGRKNALVIDIAGTSESFEFHQETPDVLWVGRRRGTEVVVRDTDVLSPDAARLSTVPAGHPMGYTDAFAAFVSDAYDAVRGGTPDGLPTFEDGVRAVLVTEAVLISAVDGDWVEVA